MKFTIRKETSSYNHRRYGKPWIATVDFSDGKGAFEFGSWVGDQYNGGEGVLTIDTSIGDIIAMGQKDFRKPRNSAPDFYVVDADGSLKDIGDKGSAFKYYTENKTKTPDFDALKSEKQALLDRIAEIDAIINDKEAN